MKPAPANQAIVPGWYRKGHPRNKAHYVRVNGTTPCSLTSPSGLRRAISHGLDFPWLPASSTAKCVDCQHRLGEIPAYAPPPATASVLVRDSPQWRRAYLVYTSPEDMVSRSMVITRELAQAVLVCDRERLPGWKLSLVVVAEDA